MNCQTPDNKNQRKGALHLTQQVDYALSLLVALAHNQNSSISAVAEETGISSAYLQKIASNLKKAELINSTRGKHGGYTLAQQPVNITIKQVIEALEGPVAITNCINDNCKLETRCQVKNGINQINNEILNYLSTKNLTHFL